MSIHRMLSYQCHRVNERYLDAHSDSFGRNHLGHAWTRARQVSPARDRCAIGFALRIHEGMVDVMDMSTPMTCGELKEEPGQLEIRFEQKLEPLTARSLRRITPRRALDVFVRRPAGFRTTWPESGQQAR